MRAEHPGESSLRPRGRWGIHQSAVGRYGSRHVRLTVLPPDLSRQGYLRWRLAHVWPVAGLLLGAIVAAITWNALGPNIALPIGEAVWLASALLVWLAARKVVSRVHTGWVDGTVDDRDGRIDRMENLAAQIETAFDEYGHGRISEEVFRGYWAHVYRALPSRRRWAGLAL